MDWWTFGIFKTIGLEDCVECSQWTGHGDNVMMFLFACYIHSSWGGPPDENCKTDIRSAAEVLAGERVDMSMQCSAAVCEESDYWSSS